MPSPTEGAGISGEEAGPPGGPPREPAPELPPPGGPDRRASAAAGDAFLGGRSSAPSPRAFALCLLLCASLQIMENLLPRLPLFPWLKAGLSHLVLLPFLLRFGPLPAGALLLGRNLLTLLFAAGPLSSFLIGSLSGLAALLAGGWLARAAVRLRVLGLAGAGMLMAVLMNLSQLAVVEGLFIRHSAFFFQLAPMFLWSALSGAAVAWLAWRSREVLDAIFDARGEVLPADLPPGEERRSGLAFLLALAALAGLFLPPDAATQGAALAALGAFSAWRGTLRAGLTSVARAWPWFLYLAWLHLLLGDGEYLWGGPITRPGALDFLRYGARLAGLVLLGPHLAASFPRRWLAGSASPYAQGLLAVLPLLPGLHGAAVGAGRAFFSALRGKRGGRDTAREAGVLRGLADGFLRDMDRARAAGR